MRFLFVLLSVMTSIYALSPRIDLRAAKIHIEHRFAEATVEEFPFPHLVIENILPDELYEQLLSFWPEEQNFSGGNGQFRQLYVNKGCSKWMHLDNESIRLFWRIFAEVVATLYINEAVKEKLMPYLDWKFPDLPKTEVEKLKKTLRFWDSRQDSLFQYTHLYQIPPHIDQIYLFATSLLYCPIDNDHEQLGTTLYTCKEGRPPEVSGDYYQGTPTLVKSIPYQRNTLLVMLQNPWQLHGSNLHDSPGYLRNLYGLFTYIAPDQVEELYKNTFYDFDLDWLHYDWEERFMNYH